MKKLILALAFVLTSACSWNQVAETSMILSLTNQALENHSASVVIIEENKELFSKDERELLVETSEAISQLRDRLTTLYAKNGLEALSEGGELLTQYQELKWYYSFAIEVVSGQLKYMPIRDRMVVERQISLVKRLDAKIDQMLVSDNDVDKKAAVEATINVLSIIAKVIIAVA